VLHPVTARKLARARSKLKARRASRHAIPPASSYPDAMTKRIVTSLALLILGYAAGTLAPRVQAADAGAGIVTELRNIHTELTNIRHLLDKH
jgi:hypothetical protein